MLGLQNLRWYFFSTEIKAVTRNITPKMVSYKKKKKKAFLLHSCQLPHGTLIYGTEQFLYSCTKVFLWYMSFVLHVFGSVFHFDTDLLFVWPWQENVFTCRLQYYESLASFIYKCWKILHRIWRFDFNGQCIQAIVLVDFLRRDVAPNDSVLE